jgi:aminopeptidase N
VSDGLKKYQLNLVSQAAESIGWEFDDKEDYLTGQLRQLLIAMAGGAGHEGIIAEAKKRFSSWKSGDKNAIHQNLRSVIFNMNVAQGGEAEYRAVKDEYIQTTSVDGKDICLAAMGRTEKHELATDLLDFVTSDSVPPQDAHGVAHSLANNNESRIVFWEYTKSKWERVHARFSVSNIIMDRWIKMGLAHYSDFGIEEDIQKFFKDKDTKAYERSLVVVSDTIEGNAKYKQRDEQLVLEWLKAYGYA